VSPVKRRLPAGLPAEGGQAGRAVKELQEAMHASERRVCRALDQPRTTQRRIAVVKTDEEALRQRMTALACEYGRYGYRRVTELLRNEGWRVNHKRVERLWRLEGLKVPKRQPKRRRLWLNDGSCIRLRPEYRNHVWSYDFVADRTSDGRPLRMLNIMDEYSRECLKIHIDRRVKATDVLYELSDLFVERGVPDFLRSENGSEFTAKQVREWLQRLGVKTLFIEPGSPWENGYIESFNGKMRDELLNGEIFDTILEAKVVTERRRKTYLPAAGRQHNTATQFTGISAPPPRRPDIPSACQWLNI